MRPLHLLPALLLLGCPSSDDDTALPVAEPLTAAEINACASAFTSDIPLPDGHVASLVEFDGEGLWASSFVYNFDFTEVDAFLTRYACDGTVLVEPFQVEPATGQLDWLNITAHGDTLLVAYSTAPDDETPPRTFLRALTTSGEPRGSDVHLGDHMEHRFSSWPEVATVDDGFLVAVSSVDRGLYAANVVHVSLDGQVTGTVLSFEEESPVYDVDVATDPLGGAHVVWSSERFPVHYVEPGADPVEYSLAFTTGSLVVLGSHTWIGHYISGVGFRGVGVLRADGAEVVRLLEGADTMYFSVSDSGGAVIAQDDWFSASSTVIHVDGSMQVIGTETMPAEQWVEDAELLDAERHVFAVDGRDGAFLHLFDFGS